MCLNHMLTRVKSYTKEELFTEKKKEKRKEKKDKVNHACMMILPQSSHTAQTQDT
jgi:hypothetical protein